jgi:site-specific recombinase XerD
VADFTDPHDPNSLTWADFERDLVSLGRSPRTIQSYREACEQLADHHKGADLTTLSRGDIQLYLIDVRFTHSAATEQVRYRSLHRFFAWCESEQLLDRSPMAGMSLPRAERKTIPVPAEDDLRKLLAACRGDDFDSVRDTAIIRIFTDCGLRLSELAHLRLGDVDRLKAQLAVLGKGARWRHVDYSVKTGKALARYLRARQDHGLAHLDTLWLGARGVALTPNGVAQMIRRRCRQAGIEVLHPHQFRHWAASAHFDAGLSEQDAMVRFGWDHHEMPRRYGSATGARRALDHARALAIGDRL